MHQLIDIYMYISLLFTFTFLVLQSYFSCHFDVASPAFWCHLCKSILLFNLFFNTCFAVLLLSSTQWTGVSTLSRYHVFFLYAYLLHYLFTILSSLLLWMIHITLSVFLFLHLSWWLYNKYWPKVSYNFVTEKTNCSAEENSEGNSGDHMTTATTPQTTLRLGGMCFNYWLLL